MRKQVELLEHHADLAPHLVDALDVGGQLDPVDADRRRADAPRARLTQRISVDLPEPDGPQMTMRSPRAHRRGRCCAAHGTRRTICARRRIRSRSSRSPRMSLRHQRRRPVASRRSIAAGIARHRDSRRRNRTARRTHSRSAAMVGPLQTGSLKRIVHRREEIDHADDRDQRRVLEQADEIVDDAGNDQRQRLRQHDEAHHAPDSQGRAPSRLRTGPCRATAGRRAPPRPYRRRRTAPCRPAGAGSGRASSLAAGTAAACCWP